MLIPVEKDPEYVRREISPRLSSLNEIILKFRKIYLSKDKKNIECHLDYMIFDNEKKIFILNEIG